MRVLMSCLVEMGFSLRFGLVLTEPTEHTDPQFGLIFSKLT